MDNYIIGIGKRIKEIRKQNQQTISDLAQKAEVSGGLISRIENGRTIPSLPVLFKIIASLDIEVTDFFQAMPQMHGNPYLISRKEDHSIIEKEDEAVGFTYEYIFGKQLNSQGFEMVMLTVAPNSKRDQVITDAFEFKYVLSGECYYQIDQEEVLVREGDSIFFDGRIPHVPINRSDAPCRMLVIYFFM